ncbi:MAG: RluA family pseudouridine synthase, partial [Planctomycetota bacterium]
KASTKLRKGDVVCAVLPPPPSTEITPQAIPLDVIYEDDDLIVINKHDDIIVHPARSHVSGTMINGLAHHFQARSSGHLSSVGDEFARPGVVHRLDRHTTGVMVFAKRDTAHWRLGRQFEHRRVEKRYLAVVHGPVEPLADVVDIPLGKHPTIKEKYAVRWDPTGRPSVTIYRVRELYKDFTLLELELKTGRTHQIRVHLAHLGYPIVGDDMYGGRKSGSDSQPLIDRPALHAARLGFTHPMTQRPLVFQAPLPADMAKLVGALRKDRFVDAPKVAGAEIDLEEAISHQPSAIRKKKNSPRRTTEDHGGGTEGL